MAWVVRGCHLKTGRDFRGILVRSLVFRAASTMSVRGRSDSGECGKVFAGVQALKVNRAKTDAFCGA